MSFRVQLNGCMQRFSSQEWWHYCPQAHTLKRLPNDQSSRIVAEIFPFAAAIPALQRRRFSAPASLSTSQDDPPTQPPALHLPADIAPPETHPSTL
mmetsp:Transcript_22408/g.38146  ORF Transcript_22408/g.38146 Transcript_22408/m.38146 type:complete len:96 (-) Transcript_22408:290-577(-)